MGTPNIKTRGSVLFRIVISVMLLLLLSRDFLRALKVHYRAYFHRRELEEKFSTLFGTISPPLSAKDVSGYFESTNASVCILNGLSGLLLLFLPLEAFFSTMGTYSVAWLYVNSLLEKTDASYSSAFLELRHSNWLFPFFFYCTSPANDPP